MIRDLKKLYVVIKDNEVIYFVTNLKKFVTDLNRSFAGVKNFAYYHKRFSEEDRNVLVTEEKEIYYLQKVL